MGVEQGGLRVDGGRLRGLVGVAWCHCGSAGKAHVVSGVQEQCFTRLSKVQASYMGMWNGDIDKKWASGCENRTGRKTYVPTRKSVEQGKRAATSPSESQILSAKSRPRAGAVTKSCAWSDPEDGGAVQLSREKEHEREAKGRQTPAER